MNQSDYYIGLMSGTSLDGVDAVLVEFIQKKPLNLIATHSHPIPDKLRSQLIAVNSPNWQGSLSTIGTLHQELGKLFADASNQLIQQSFIDNKIDRKQICAIGSHGQTLWHQPDGKFPFSLQLGDANLVAELTGITTVADFRSRDIAAGGQGAPLVPAFHQKIFSNPKKSRVILNIGGIANITILPATTTNKPVSGFDTGPGNTLLDSWIKQHKNVNYDNHGEWASHGKIIPEVLNILLEEPYLSLPAPKSTGKELFNIDWLTTHSNRLKKHTKAEDIQATLSEFTARTIADNIPSECTELYICGGGIHNTFLINRLKELLPTVNLFSTEALGIDPNWMEAIAFAWLTKQTMEGKSGNLPEVTGAAGKRILGAIYSGTPQ